MSKQYHERPSILLGIRDSYTAYCFDEACAYIVSRIQDGEEPNFSKTVTGNFSSASELYKKMGYKPGTYKKSKS